MLNLFIVLDNSLNSNWYKFYFYFINVTNYIELYKNLWYENFLIFLINSINIQYDILENNLIL